MTITTSALLVSMILIICISFTQGSNYDPHYPSGDEGLFFEGWYTRIVDPTNHVAFAAVAGSYCPKSTSCNNMEGNAGYLAFVYQLDSNSKFDVIETYPNSTFIYVGPEGEPVTKNPAFATPPDFLWKTTTTANITNSTISLSFSDVGYSFFAEMSDVILWDPSNPGEGPEGIVDELPLQQHWFVYSLASEVLYSVTLPDGSSISGSGFAHQEKNWGSSFPSEWVWAEGISEDKTRQFALSGGKVPVVGPIGVHAWLLGFRSPSISWNFRPQDIPTIFTPEINACNGTFTMTASYFTQTIKLSMSAPLSTFTPLAIPSSAGFVPDGCVESYATTVLVQAYEGDDLVDEFTFTSAALEFGGNYMCSN
eukprot:TRINITY_DN2384_c0_g1_i1.p1 TRINITY_DN2384_c0_g1~~TRINITY_DN2384_c0_g1_i1.p1  ORF type:complete len:366 (+),score=101.64 TRINITY_DN2384_c0_g1_i1:139-1236(+)